MPLAFRFIELVQADSTNNYARILIKNKNAQHGTTIFAHEQLQGRGQHGKTWHTEPSKNIIATVIIKQHERFMAQPFAILMLTALAVKDFLFELTEVEAVIKWPNDIFIDDKKAGGILVETILPEDEQNTGEKFAIIGMGINLNQTDFLELNDKATSLQLTTGKLYNAVTAAQQLGNFLVTAIDNYAANPNFDELLQRYNQHLYKAQQTVRLKKNNIAFDAFIKGVNHRGELQVTNCLWDSFNFGEVEWVR